MIAGDRNIDLLAGSGVGLGSYGPKDTGAQRRFLIDHVAVPPGNADVTVVQARAPDGVQLSDHPMVICSWEPDLV